MPDAENVMTGFLTPPPPPEGTYGFSLLVAPKPLVGRAPASLCPHLAAGNRVRWVDAGNRFDLYGLSRAAQALGQDPRVVLDNIELIRPFTAFQLEKSLGGSSPLPRVLADPMKPFYDPDLPQGDAVRLFARFLGRLVRSRVPTLVLAVQRTPPEERKMFSQHLKQQAKHAALITTNEDIAPLPASRRRGVAAS